MDERDWDDRDFRDNRESVAPCHAVALAKADVRSVVPGRMCASGMGGMRHRCQGECAVGRTRFRVHKNAGNRNGRGKLSRTSCMASQHDFLEQFA